MPCPWQNSRSTQQCLLWRAVSLPPAARAIFHGQWLLPTEGSFPWAWLTACVVGGLPARSVLGCEQPQASSEEQRGWAGYSLADSLQAKVNKGGGCAGSIWSWGGWWASPRCSPGDVLCMVYLYHVIPPSPEAAALASLLPSLLTTIPS